MELKCLNILYSTFLHRFKRRVDSNLISNSLEVLRYNTTDSSKAKTISQCLHTKLLKV